MPFSTSPSPPPPLTSYTHLNLDNMHENCANVLRLFLMIGNQYYFYSNMKNLNKSIQQNPSTPFYKKKCVQKHIDLTCFEIPICIESEKVVQYFDVISIYTFWNWFVLLNCIMQTLKEAYQFLFLCVTFLL